MALTETQEIIRNIGELKSETSATLATLQAKVDGINHRLDISNGRIASHDEAIQQLRIHETQFSTDLAHLQQDRDTSRAFGRQWRLAVIERCFWFLGAMVLAAIVHFAGF